MEAGEKQKQAEVAGVEQEQEAVAPQAREEVREREQQPEQRHELEGSWDFPADGSEEEEGEDGKVEDWDYNSWESEEMDQENETSVRAEVDAGWLRHAGRVPQPPQACHACLPCAARRLAKPTAAQHSRPVPCVLCVCVPQGRDRAI